MSDVALIPARKGSQRLPRKNISDFCGKPLIAWTIEAAIHSEKFSSITVSTDSPEIEEISREYGADVISRPESLSQNNSPAKDVMLHFLEANEGAERVAFLQPTSPLRTAQHISEAVDLSLASGGTSVASCYLLQAGHSWRLSEPKGQVGSAGVLDLRIASRNQSIAVLNGAIYLVVAESFLANPVFVAKGTIPYFMNRWDSIDIDFREDWHMAEYRFTEKILRQSEQ